MYFNFYRATNLKLLKQEQIDLAIYLLFGHVSDPAKKELTKFINERFSSNECVALFITKSNRCEGNLPFLDLCQKLGIDPGTKEVILTEKVLLYSPNYETRPEIYKKW